MYGQSKIFLKCSCLCEICFWGKKEKSAGNVGYCGKCGSLNRMTTISHRNHRVSQASVKTFLLYTESSGGGGM